MSNTPRRLLHIYLLKVIIQKDVLHIQLKQRKQDMNGVEMSHKRSPDISLYKSE